MENIDEMRNRHKKEIEILQNRCNHKGKKEWMPYMWAPGHFGSDVKVCKICGKILERKNSSSFPKLCETIRKGKVKPCKLN